MRSNKETRERCFVIITIVDATGNDACHGKRTMKVADACLMAGRTCPVALSHSCYLSAYLRVGLLGNSPSNSNRGARTRKKLCCGAFGCRLFFVQRFDPTTRPPWKKHCILWNFMYVNFNHSVSDTSCSFRRPIRSFN